MTDMESINVIIDDHGKTSKRNPNEEDKLFWGIYSQKIRTTRSKHSSLIENNGNSSSHSNIDGMTTPVEAISVDHFKACTSEASTSTSQQTNEFPTQLPDAAGSSIQKLMPLIHIAKNHPSNSIIGDVQSGVTTRKKEMRDYAKMVANVCYTSTVEPTIVTGALTDEHWLLAMQEELL
ncbi:putative mitochondrial protein [Cucumis melo var. makuwa]|uniref:Mitochondrial protein n=1 Tax=Cucumis melo var. makuwa TaxID=1194695 RepID=A0A5A7SQH0_CUCMM|nr:putative mitochondrial protein [Cucumis melo var. makuwa]TYK23515.1 putative mitochondrial protein [Cucumis melo var. makuwa]